MSFTGTAAMLAAAEKALADYRQSAINMPAAGRDAQRAAEKALGRARDLITQTANSVTATAADRSQWPAGRRDAIEVATRQAVDEIREALSQIEMAATVMKAGLTVAAMPKLNPKDATLARQDALMILDRTPVDRLSSTIDRLAQRGDAVGALVNTEWTRDYIAARTPDMPSNAVDAMMTITTATAIDAAAASGDPERAAAAASLAAVGPLLGTRDALATATTHMAREATSVANRISDAA